MRCAISCECGFTVEAEADDLVPAAQEHARRAHGMHLDRRLVLAMAQPVDDKEDAGLPIT